MKGAGSTLKGLAMTPQFLRSEAARFREMAESVTDREASRQRLLGMALDYEARAAAADAVRAAEPQPEPEPEEPLPVAERAPPLEEAPKTRPGRRRLTL
jgi:hypothetical protein